MLDAGGFLSEVNRWQDTCKKETGTFWFATNVEMEGDRNLKTEPDVNGIDSIKETVKMGAQNIAREQWGWYTTSKQKATTFCGTLASRISIVSSSAHFFRLMEVKVS
jgi:hypothetical protein